MQITRKDSHRRKALRMRNLFQSKPKSRFCRYVIDHVKISFLYLSAFPSRMFWKITWPPTLIVSKTLLVICAHRLISNFFKYFTWKCFIYLFFLELLLEKKSPSARDSMPSQSEDFLDWRRNECGWSRGGRSTSVKCPADWTSSEFHSLWQRRSWKSLQAEKVLNLFEETLVHWRVGENWQNAILIVNKSKSGRKIKWRLCVCWLWQTFTIKHG